MTTRIIKLELWGIIFWVHLIINMQRPWYLTGDCISSQNCYPIYLRVNPQIRILKYNTFRSINQIFSTQIWRTRLFLTVFDKMIYLVELILLRGVPKNSLLGFLGHAGSMIFSKLVLNSKIGCISTSFKKSYSKKVTGQSKFAIWLYANFFLNDMDIKLILEFKTSFLPVCSKNPWWLFFGTSCIVKLHKSWIGLVGPLIF